MDVHLQHHPLGLSWVVTDEALQRAAHALADEGRVWLIDPFEDEAALAAVAELGEPVAVVQLLDRHARDCEAIAGRLGVPHLRLPTTVPGSPFMSFSVVDVPRWRERGLWWGERNALVVAEAVGTPAYFTAGRKDTAGVHPFLRAVPPGPLRPYVERTEHLLCGHGEPILRTGGAALDDALHRSRRDIPRALVGLPFRFR